MVRYEDFVEDPARSGPQLLEHLAEALPSWPSLFTLPRSPAAGAPRPGSFLRRYAPPPDRGPRCLERAGADGTQLSLYKWFRELPEGWVELARPEEAAGRAHNALVTTAEYFAAVADRSGMETAYDDERHKALHFEQATELKDHHIERLEAEFRKLRQRAETGGATRACAGGADQ